MADPSGPVEHAPETTQRTNPSKPPTTATDPATANVYELTGYNPKRHEFDPEFDNEAEGMVAEMEFKEEDTPEDVE